jgi:hypothetical protein
LDESASAALAANNAYNVSCLLDELNSQAAGDISPTGKKCRCKDRCAGDQISRYYFGLEDVVLEDTSNEIWCVFDELVVPDKCIIIGSEDLTEKLSDHIPCSNCSGESAYCRAARRQLCYNIGILLLQYGQKLFSCQYAIGSIPVLKNKMLTVSIGRRATNPAFAPLIPPQIAPKL